MDRGAVTRAPVPPSTGPAPARRPGPRHGAV